MKILYANLTDRLLYLMKGIITQDNLTPEKFDAMGKIHAKLVMSYCKPTDKILDFGCGLGRVLKYLPETAEGYDPNSEVREYARAWCGREILADVSGRENAYNFVIAILVVQHIPVKGNVEKLLANLLKPHGKLLTIDTKPEFSKLPGYVFSTHFMLVQEQTRGHNILRVYSKKECLIYNG